MNCRGAFRCLPACTACGAAAMRIALGSRPWGRESEQLQEPTRECVREFLRGLRARAEAVKGSANSGR